ncbi:hypothetical protein I4U23_017545 [Adineta vaga]|nr:hypothetical protein I4U23_017545 [Adineta vaga]
MSRERDGSVTVYVGDLSRNASEEEIEKAFSYYGTVKSVWISKNPSGYGFVDFQNQRDAVDAVKGLDGKVLCSRRIRVEFSHGRKRGRREQENRRRSRSQSLPQRRRFSPRDVCFECGDRGHYAYDCPVRMRHRQREKSRSRSRSPRRQRTKRSSPRRSKRERRRSRSKSHSQSSSSSRN